MTDAGPRPDRVISVLTESFDIEPELAKEAASGQRSLIGGYATVEGARLAVSSAGGTAETPRRRDPGLTRKLSASATRTGVRTDGNRSCRTK